MTTSHDDAPRGAEAVVDELLPDMDWQRLVRTYPTPALLLSFAGGLYLGYRRGPALLTAVAAFTVREMTRRVAEYLGDESLGDEPS
jgi:hypothetical protein